MENDQITMQNSETHDKMTKIEAVNIGNYALSLYHKGLRAKDATILIQKEVETNYNKSIKPITAQDIFYKVRKEYLQMVPMLNAQEATKEAVLEMESLEDDIINNVTTENPAKYNVLLETKKHKHNILGINKNNAPIEINIGTSSDNLFLASQNNEKENPNAS